MREEGFVGWRLWTVSVWAIALWPVLALSYVFDVYVYPSPRARRVMGWLLWRFIDLKNWFQRRKK